MDLEIGLLLDNIVVIITDFSGKCKMYRIVIDDSMWIFCTIFIEILQISSVDIPDKSFQQNINVDIHIYIVLNEKKLFQN